MWFFFFGFFFPCLSCWFKKLSQLWEFVMRRLLWSKPFLNSAVLYVATGLTHLSKQGKQFTQVKLRD